MNKKRLTQKNIIDKKAFWDRLSTAIGLMVKQYYKEAENKPVKYTESIDIEIVPPSDLEGVDSSKLQKMYVNQDCISEALTDVFTRTSIEFYIGVSKENGILYIKPCVCDIFAIGNPQPCEDNPDEIFYNIDNNYKKCRIKADKKLNYGIIEEILKVGE